MISQVAHAAVSNVSQAADQFTKALSPAKLPLPTSTLRSGSRGPFDPTTADVRARPTLPDSESSWDHEHELGAHLLVQAGHTSVAFGDVLARGRDVRETPSVFAHQPSLSGAPMQPSHAALSAQASDGGASQNQSGRQESESTHSGWTIKAVGNSLAADLPAQPRVGMVLGHKGTGDALPSQKEAVKSGAMSPMTSEISGLFGALERHEVDAAQFYAALERLSNTPHASPAKFRC